MSKLLRSIMSKLFNFTNIDILEKFPCLADLGCGAFGEDADTFGDTLREVIESDPETRGLPFKRQTIDELKILLTYSDRDIERISRIVLGINPTVDHKEPPDRERWRRICNRPMYL